MVRSSVGWISHEITFFCHGVMLKINWGVRQLEERSLIPAGRYFTSSSRILQTAVFKRESNMSCDKSKSMHCQIRIFRTGGTTFARINYFGRFNKDHNHFRPFELHCFSINFEFLQCISTECHLKRKETDGGACHASPQQEQIGGWVFCPTHSHPKKIHINK